MHLRVLARLLALTLAHLRECLPLHGYTRLRQVYASSKLGNSLFTTELSRRLKGSPVDCMCVSPGMVDTGLWRDYPFWCVFVFGICRCGDGGYEEVVGLAH